MDFNIQLGDWDKLQMAAQALRHAVFVIEQHVPVELEIDEMDPHCLHALAYAGTQVVGTGRLLPDGHIGRMAVAREWRGRGAGSALLSALINAAAQRGEQSVVLHAQLHAIPFYRRHGFAAEGSVFRDAGIDHIAMRRVLSAAPQAD